MNTEKGFDLNLKFYDGELKSLRIKTLLSIKYVGRKKKRNSFSESPNIVGPASLRPETTSEFGEDLISISWSSSTVQPQIASNMGLTLFQNYVGQLGPNWIWLRPA